MTQNKDSGVLFKNNRKTQDKHPDYTGEANVNDTEYRMAAWIKQGIKEKFMSIAFTPKDEQSRPANPVDDELDGDIPF